MTNAFETIKDVTQIFSLLAFLSTVAFFAFSRYLKYRGQVANDISDERRRIEYLQSWLNLDTSTLTKEQTFSLAEGTIAFQSRRFLIVGSLSLIAFICSLIFLAVIVFLNRNGSNDHAAACAEKLRQADTQRGYPSIALSLYIEAEPICGQTDHRPVVGQGASYYDLARYPDAERRFSDAYERAKSAKASPQNLGLLLINRAYALEGMLNFPASLELYRQAIKNFAPSSDFYRSTAFSIGRMLTAIWASKEYPNDTENRRDALKQFSEFLDAGGIPRRWAYYNLACLRSEEKATDGPYGEPGKLLIDAAQEIANDSGVGTDLQKSMFRTLITNPGTYQRRPTRPIPCPGLEKIMNNCNCKTKVLEIIARF